MPVFDAGRAEPGGIDVFAESADHALWIALLAPEAPRPDQQPAVNDEVRAALGGGDTGAPSLISIGVVPALKIPEALEDVSAPSPAPVMWEITTQGRTTLETDYLTLDPLPGADGTNGLTRPGVLRLSLPDESLIWAPVERRRRESRRRRRRYAAAHRRRRPRGAAARLAPAPAARRAAGRSPAADLDRHQRGRHRSTDDAGRPRAGRIDRRRGSGVLAAAGLGRCRPRCRCRSRSPAAATSPGTGSTISRRSAATRGWRAKRPRSSSMPKRGRCASATACAGACPSGRCAYGLASGRFGGGRAGNLPAGSLAEMAALRIDGSPAPALKVAQPLATIGGADAETIAERAAADSVVSPPSRARGDRRGLQGARLRGARHRRRPRRRAAALQAARSALRRAGRGLGDGIAGAVAVGAAEPAPGSAVHRAPARVPVEPDAARDRALCDRLRVRAARPLDRRDDSRRTRPRRDAVRRARGVEAAALAAAAGRHRRRRLAARPRRARARNRSGDLARRGRPRGRRDQPVPPRRRRARTRVASAAAQRRRSRRRR